MTTKNQLERRVTALEKTLAETRGYLIETRATLLKHMQMDIDYRRLVAGSAGTGLEKQS